MTDDSVAAWLDTLAAKGVEVRLRGRRLEFVPKQAYGTLTDVERTFLREHKSEIAARIDAGVSVHASPTSTPAPALVPAPRPLHCEYCMRSPCVGEAHPMFEVLHYADPDEVWRRRARQRDHDWHDWSMRRRYGLD